jgi:hypothetical protein
VIGVQINRHRRQQRLPPRRGNRASIRAVTAATLSVDGCARPVHGQGLDLDWPCHGAGLVTVVDCAQWQGSTSVIFGVLRHQAGRIAEANPGTLAGVGGRRGGR